jgi:hypothetical protein
MGLNPVLVIVDTLHRAMPGGDENAAKEMGIVITNGALIQRLLRCTLMPVHHSGKDFERGMRGSTGLPGASDTILRMTRDEDGNRALLLVEKQKDGEDGQEHHLISQGIVLPPGPNGKPRNSLVLVPTGAPEAAARKPKKLQGDNAIGHATLVDTVVKEGEALPQGDGFPTTPMRGTTELAWRREFYRRLTARTHEAQKRAFSRMMKDLRDLGRVGFCDTRVWLVRQDDVPL